MFNLRETSETVRNMLFTVVRDDEPNGVTLTDADRERLAVALARTLLRRANVPSGQTWATWAELSALPAEIWATHGNAVAHRLARFRLAREQRLAREEREPDNRPRLRFARLAGRVVRCVG